MMHQLSQIVPLDTPYKLGSPRSGNVDPVALNCVPRIRVDDFVFKMSVIGRDHASRRDVIFVAGEQDSLQANVGGSVKCRSEQLSADALSLQ